MGDVSGAAKSASVVERSVSGAHLAALDSPLCGDVCGEWEPSPMGDVSGAATSASVVEDSVA